MEGVYSFRVQVQGDLYELQWDYPNHNQHMLVNSSMEVPIEVIHRYTGENGNEEELVQGYRLEINRDENGDLCYDTDLVHVEVMQDEQGVPRRIIVLTYRSHTADYYRHLPFHVYFNVLRFTARFFLFILTISSLTLIVFHVTKKEKEQPLPQFVLSLISCVCRKQCLEQDLCPNDSGPLLIAVTSTLL